MRPDRAHGRQRRTPYNLYCTREALIDEVITDLAAARLDAVGRQATAFDDVRDGCVRYVEAVCEAQASDPALVDVVSGSVSGCRAADVGVCACVRARDAAAQIVERAQRAGSLRADFAGEDLLLAFSASALLARASARISPGVWRRVPAFQLVGLRAENAGGPIDVAPLDARQTFAVMGGPAGGR